MTSSPDQGRSGSRGHEDDDIRSVLTAMVDAVSEHFLDRDYLTTDEWSTLSCQLRELPDDDGDDEVDFLVAASGTRGRP